MIGRSRHRRTIVVVLALLGALALLTVAGFLDRYHWLFEIPVAFRVQYAVLALALSVAGVFLGDTKSAAGGLALVAINAAVVAPAWIPRAEPRLAGSETVRLLIANVERGSGEHAALAALVEEVDPDVLGLIELTPAWAGALDGELEPFGARVLDVHDDPYGIGLYSRRPLAAAQIERFPAHEGPPSVVASLELGETPVTVLLTHVHTPLAGGVHARHIDAIGEARGRLGEHLVVCGDFNTVAWAAPVRRACLEGPVAPCVPRPRARLELADLEPPRRHPDRPLPAQPRSWPLHVPSGCARSGQTTDRCCSRSAWPRSSRRASRAAAPRTTLRLGRGTVAP